MTRLLVEAAVDAVREYLLDHIEAEVDSVNSSYSMDEFSISYPQSIEIAEQQIMPPTPCIMVIADSSAPEVDQVSWFESRHQLAIIVIDSDPDSNVLRRKLYRQVLAVFNTLQGARSTAALGSVKQLFWGTPYAEYSPIYAQQGSSGFFQDAHLNISVWLNEG